MSRTSRTLRGCASAQTRSGPGMNHWSLETWRTVIDSSPDGVVICDARAADCPVVYVNPAFCQMCGYSAAALTGANLRLLQGMDRQQESRQRMKEAIERGES